MSEHPLRPWSQVVHLPPGVERGDTAVVAYAIDLGALVAGCLPGYGHPLQQPAEYSRGGCEQSMM